MILDALLSIPYALIWAFLSLLPEDTGTYTEIGNAFSYFVGQANAWSYIVPVSTMMQVTGIIVGIEIAIMAWRFGNWILKVLPDWISGG